MSEARGAVATFIDRAYAHLRRPTDPAVRTPWTQPAPEGLATLATHLEKTYGVHVAGPPRAMGGAYLIPRSDGPDWVARVYGGRSRAAVEGDAAVLALLEARGFPSERLAADDPISDLAGETVVVTLKAEGEMARPQTETHLRLLGELHGRLQGLRAEGGLARPAGGWHGLSLEGGGRDADIEALRPLLADTRTRLDADQAGHLDRIEAALASIDLCSDLPCTPLHVDMGGPNVLWSGAKPTVIDWAGAGVGPRVHGLATLMAGAGNLALVDAFLEGYRDAGGDLTDAELARLGPGLRIHGLVLEGWVAVFAPDRLAKIAAGLDQGARIAEAVAERVRRAF